jgi:hypothetical protein
MTDRITIIIDPIEPPKSGAPVPVLCSNTGTRVTVSNSQPVSNVSIVPPVQRFGSVEYERKLPGSEFSIRMAERSEEQPGPFKVRSDVE